MVRSHQGGKDGPWSVASGFEMLSLSARKRQRVLGKQVVWQSCILKPPLDACWRRIAGDLSLGVGAPSGLLSSSRRARVTALD